MQDTGLGVGCGLARACRDEDLDLPPKSLPSGRRGKFCASWKNHKDRRCGQCPEKQRALWDLRKGGMVSILHDLAAREHPRHSERVHPCPLAPGRPLHVLHKTSQFHSHVPYLPRSCSPQLTVLFALGP